MIRSKLKSVARRVLRREDSRPAPPRAASEPSAGLAMDGPTLDEHEVAEDLEVEGHEVAGWIDIGQRVVFVDIREPHEVGQSHIEGAWLVPMNQVPQRVYELPRDKTLVIYCAVGQRSFGVAHYLREQGLHDTWSLVGGIGAWGEQEGRYVMPPHGARFKPTQPARLSPAAAERLGRAAAGTIQEARATDDGVRYVLGVPGHGDLERIADLVEADLEPVGRG